MGWGAARENPPDGRSRRLRSPEKQILLGRSDSNYRAAGARALKKEGSRPLLVVAESGGKRSRRYSEPVSRSFEEWCQTAGPSIGKIHGATRDSASADWLSLASSSALAVSCPGVATTFRTWQRADGREIRGGSGLSPSELQHPVRSGALPGAKGSASRASELYPEPRGQLPE